MTASTATAHPTAATPVTWSSMARGVLGLLRDVPLLARQRPSLIHVNEHRKWSVGKAFADAAARHPDSLFLRTGQVVHSYGECNRRANRWAAVLAAHGVRRGDVVAVMAHNSPECVIAMLAIVKLGAVTGMVNYNQPGDALNHSFGVLVDANRDGAPLVVIHDDECGELLAGLGDVETEPIGLAAMDAEGAALTAADPTAEANPAAADEVRASDPAYYIFTSGTTGWPKASVMSHGRWQVAMNGFSMGLRLRPDDVLFVTLPFYHNNALTVCVATAVAAGACLAVSPKFSASRFWDEAIENEATAFCYIGELCRYLLAQPPKPTDRAHSIRLAAGNGLRPEIWDEFVDRFGIERIVEFYAASESNIGFVNILDQRKTVGFCPLPYVVVAADEDSGLPIRGADGRVTRVEKGRPGLLLGKISPLARIDGYTDPAATEKKIVRDAFKDGDSYFNTGDLVTELGFRHIAFVDRLGDTFRWKGENVATTEVEATLNGAPGIVESVVYGVRVPGADGRAGMAAIVVEDGFDAAALAAELRARLPHYAVPLYLRVVSELARTSTFKNQRVALREEGYGDVGQDPVYELTDDGYVPMA
ncbi:long-chain-acyl-CoA synthetase [Gordonia neofelifaecis]|uniref:Long-chain-acyl-CoA synthetase n=1 Tax=Gordonia neofelifaecis NRRL B-59395 TaxID=644548 RepID=F1YK51_9ACTN|nr:long-chain-acyl-CoA synthetase [Gordonia neofelifaecis]EGD54897.1 long-chain-acyl-CoA synthetase [Gordonia neofelifaecis NRRL B-59395]